MPKAAVWIAPPVVAMLSAWLALGGTQWSLRVPFFFSGDALFYLAQSKSTLDHGWWWVNPSIGAPLGVHALAFAQNTNVDQAIVRIVGLFTREVGLAVNLAWLIMLGLSAVTSTWCLRRLGVSRLGAGAAGVLFALTPFALYRNIGHFNMVTYLIPFPATVAVLLASFDNARPLRLRDVIAPMAGCVLVGFNYIYFAFFGAFVIMIGALIGFVRARSIAPLKLGGVCLGALLLATSLNMIPNVLVWREYGEARGVRHLQVESEIYGLKIRHLVSPTEEHWFPPFNTWLARDQSAGFPYENENTSARLGTVAGVGFLGLMAAIIFPSGRTRDESSQRLHATALIVLALILLGTVGGFGALFSLLISPAIRAYNRVSPFIAFLALTAVGIWIDRVIRLRSFPWQAAAWMGVLAVGVTDQYSALFDQARDVPGIQRELTAVSSFVGRLESSLPANASVFQLPLRPYPLDNGQHRLGAYDQFKPYLAAHRLRWSYPALTDDQILWQRDVEAVPEQDLPRYLARQGFSAILISRGGYRDEGAALEQTFTTAGGATRLDVDDRYIALDVRHLQPPGVPR